jgi:hypothetical protein
MADKIACAAWAHTTAKSDALMIGKWSLMLIKEIWAAKLLGGIASFGKVSV